MVEEAVRTYATDNEEDLAAQVQELLVLLDDARLLDAQRLDRISALRVELGESLAIIEVLGGWPPEDRDDFHVPNSHRCWSFNPDAQTERCDSAEYHESPHYRYPGTFWAHSDTELGLDQTATEVEESVEEAEAVRIAEVVDLPAKQAQEAPVKKVPVKKAPVKRSPKKQAPKKQADAGL